MSVTAARATIVGVLVVVLGIGLPATPAGAQLSVTGQWSTMSVNAPVQPIHVALLRTGKVLMVEGSSNDSTQNVYRYTIWNPAAGTFATGTTPWDLFCNSMSFFPDGRLLISGGNLSYNPYTGLKTTTIFDPLTEKFIQVEDMAKGRWYPTTVMLKDGGVMTFSGLDENAVINPQTEIYDVGHGWSPPYTAPFGPKWYPRLHLLTNGLVLMTGPSAGARTFNPGTGTWSSVITNHPALNESRMYGTSVMLPLRPHEGYKGRFFVTGGNTSNPYAGAHILDTSLPSWSFRAIASLDQPRVTHNAVLLPNGKVLVVGGSSTFNVASTAAMNALMFDPATETWGPAGRIAFPRMYHSTAILLPDATVWLGGTNTSEGVWQPKMEIYKPPYLFTSTGAPAPRPSISSSPSVAGYKASFSIGTPQAAGITQVVLVRPGSATHAFDMEQRLVELSFTKGSGALTATMPPNAMIAPPGYYLLFVLQNGVPSVGKFVRLSENPGNQPPVATITNPSTKTISIQAGQSVTFAGSASDANGSVAVYQWLFPGGSPAKSTVQNPGAVKFLTPGTYTASLTVLDNLGENNVSPPTVTVVVGAGTPTGTTVSIAAIAQASEVGPKPGTFRVTRTGNIAAALAVKYTVTGTATPGADYTALPGTVTIPAGATTADFNVTPVNDTLMEPPETVVVNLAAGTGYSVGSPSSATVTIASDETVRITATDPSATEAGLTTGTFTVTRTGTSTATLTVKYTVSGTATSGSDYSALPGSVTIPAGATSATITVKPVNDTLMESPETVTLTLASAPGYTVGSPASASVTIASDEVVRITATDASATEAGPTTGRFSVSRTGGAAAALTVKYTVGGTAAAGSDYKALVGSVTIPAGATTATVVVSPVNDTLKEGAETVVVKLIAGPGYTVGSPSVATVTIADND
ncbi:MAG TPA: Calx-beta domain-containing protein [Methylomirabilota bacterium]|jgi:hypothetical protein